MFGEDKYSHAKEHGRLLKAQILHNVRVVEVLERLALRLQRLHDRHLPLVFPIAGGLRNFDLLHGDHLSSRRIQRKIDAAVGALPDEFASNPLEDRWLHW
jgi:hypothetical protein